VYYHHARNVLTRLYPAQNYDAGEVARLVNHISEFSLAALAALARKKAGAPQ
jgi:hypothetical protein